MGGRAGGRGGPGGGMNLPGMDGSAGQPPMYQGGQPPPQAGTRPGINFGGQGPLGAFGVTQGAVAPQASPFLPQRGVGGGMKQYQPERPVSITGPSFEAWGRR